MLQFNSNLEAERWFNRTSGSQETFSFKRTDGARVTLTLFGTLGMIAVDAPVCEYVHLPF